MADVKKDGKGAAEAGKETNTRKAHKGAAKRRAAERVGAKSAWMPIDQQTPAKSVLAMNANGRSALAGGRKPRTAPEINVEAFKPIHACYGNLAPQFVERGLPKVAMQGAELLCDQLAVAAEVDSFSPRGVGGVAWTDQLAYVHKLRESVSRLHPAGPARRTLR